MDPRKPAFDGVIAVCPQNPFNDPGNIHALHNLLDAFGAPREVEGDAFGAALALILSHEGGFVNHPRDPGGMTNLGVTKATYEAWVGRRVTEQEMRGLTKGIVAPIYRKNYWEAVQCDKLPGPLALCVFDFAVNAGPARAARYLQSVADVERDGIVGEATLSAVQRLVASVGVAETVRRYQDTRRRYYRQLSTYPTFGRGWLRRVDETEKAAMEMIR